MKWTRIAAIALSVGVASAASAGAIGAESGRSDDATEPNAFSIEETWAHVAPEMGKHLPMSVDDETMWLTVSNEGRVLVSTFRKNLPKEEIVASKDEMERSAIENTCRGTERGKELLDAGGIVRQVFYDRNDQLAVTIDVDGESCRRN